MIIMNSRKSSINYSVKEHFHLTWKSWYETPQRCTVKCFHVRLGWSCGAGGRALYTRDASISRFFISIRYRYDIDEISRHRYRYL